jgi:hypothetical protein
MAASERHRQMAEEALSMKKTPARATVTKQEETNAAEGAKTMRLRALRLAKEAADREAAQIAAAAELKERSVASSKTRRKAVAVKAAN